MSQKPLTLNDVRKSDKISGKKREFRASDFLTKDEQIELRQSNFRGRKAKKRFNDIDAYVAEIIGRFGYDFYKDWQSGKISTDKTNRYIAAERAREKSQFLSMEAIIMLMVGSCIQRSKGQPAPRGPKTAQKIFKAEEKIAKGEF